MKKINFKIKDKEITVSIVELIVALVSIVCVIFLIVYGANHINERRETIADQVELEVDLDLDYDSSQGTIQVGEFAGTILEETEDAGDEYIESTLFLGDSNTARFLTVTNADGKTYTNLNNTIGVVGMGIDAIGGTAVMQFSNGLYTIPQAVKLLQPERVIITFGTNNLSGTDTDATSFIERYQKGIQAIVDAYPSVDIIVNSIPPVSKNRHYTHVTMTQIDAYNRAIVEMCAENDWKYLNGSEALKDPSTGYAKEEYTIADGLHLSQKGIETLFKYIRTHAWITEDDRPKPLTDIPTIIGVPDGLFSTDPLTNEEYTKDVLVNDSEYVVEEVETVETEETYEPTVAPTATPVATPTPTPVVTPTPTPMPTATPTADTSTQQGCEAVRGAGAWYNNTCYNSAAEGLAQKQADEAAAQQAEAERIAAEEAAKQVEQEAAQNTNNQSNTTEESQNTSNEATNTVEQPQDTTVVEQSNEASVEQVITEQVTE